MRGFSGDTGWLFFLFETAGFAQCLTQHVFDLRIDAAQLIVRPVLHRIQDFGIDSQRKRFFLCHNENTAPD